MKILYFAPRFPLPSTGGDRILTERYLRALGRRWEVHFLGFADGEPVSERLVRQLKSDASLASVTVLPLGPSKVWHAARAAAGGRALQAGYYWQPAAVRAFDRLIATVEPDLVVLQTVRLLPYLERVPDGARTAIHFVDALSNNYNLSSRVAQSLVWRLVFRHEAHRLEKMERVALARASARFAVSREDARYLDTLAPAGAPPVITIPTGVDTEYFRCEAMPLSPQFRIAFLGRMSTRANEDAAVWIAREVLPLLPPRVGRELHFTIIGAEPSARVRALQSRQITITGGVDDIRPALWNSDLTVAPMRIATGIQFKILQSLALGRPVVASETSVRGLGAASLPGLFVADGPEATADGIGEIYRNFEQLRLEMPRASQEVGRAFSWDTHLGLFMDSLEQVVARPPGRQRAERPSAITTP